MKTPMAPGGRSSLTTIGQAGRSQAAYAKGAGNLPAPDAARLSSSAFDDVDDFPGLRTDDDVTAVHQDHFIAAPLRIDLYDPGRKRIEVNRRRNSRTNRYIEVHVGCFLDVRRLDGGSDLGALLRRRSRGRRGGGVARGGLRLRALGLGVGV